MLERAEILKYYQGLCDKHKKKLTRHEYRKTNPQYKSGAIEKLWGSWTAFSEDVGGASVKEGQFVPTRYNICREFNKDAEVVVLTHIYDGAPVDMEALAVLYKYCEHRSGQLGVLWGKNIHRNRMLADDEYTVISPYLATEFTFALDKQLLAKDYNVAPTVKNPLLNIEKINKQYNINIVGAAKQFMRVLPYKQYNPMRIAATTGTLSHVTYKNTLSNCVDAELHTFGAIVLEYSQEAKRYIPRNLVYKDGEIYDGPVVYNKDGVKSTASVAAMILGDLHLPEHDVDALAMSSKYINVLKPEHVMIHDVASWNSISHHEATQYLDKARNITPETRTLEDEFNEVTKHLNALADEHPDTTFNIVPSNHDEFITKWLNSASYAKDPHNAYFGSVLFGQYFKHNNILSGVLRPNMGLLPRNTSFNVCGYELNEHGDCGISGARGGAIAFNKGFSKIVVGHTHSPEINGTVGIVGTLSKLKLNYNQKGLTKWAHCDGIVHHNGTFQLLFHW